ncbi:hypothetical protein GCM10009133_11580 [Cocleimonas flava]|uniref:Uncharacterized protein n=1 Tax=Cocleimonas flava TaxID=634765 RepID=A0A4R1F281_9GAMM|nr:hypothetical protein [Cocleimonas flava]TCJ87520.1 hypothetical protein EV695_2030 [Cocleimonas flava]
MSTTLDVFGILKEVLPTILPSVAIAGAAAVLVNVLTSRIIKPEKQADKAKEKLFNLLNKHLSDGGELDLDFLNYLKSSIEREFNIVITISHVLEDFLVHRLQSSKNEKDGLDTLQELKELLESENKIKPFDSLPSEERRLLKGLRDSINNDVSPESTYYFIDELSTVMSVRHQEYSRAHQTNKWSVPLAIIGLIFTIIFGLISLFSAPNEEKIAANLSKELTNQKENSLVK